MTAPIRIAVVGLGKIAHDQHLPSIDRSSSFELVATVSRGRHSIGDAPSFADIRDLAESGIAIDAVALCTPPQTRRQIAEVALHRGWHTFLEKPPGATLAEVVALRDLAARQGVSLFASWHSRFAAGVEPAREWLAERTIRSATITWRENVRQWHPGQDWIFEPGGFGVFDPGINALSIATRILPHPLFVDDARIDVPGNRAAPIASQVNFQDVTGAPVRMDLDFLQEGQQTWDIVVDTDDGQLKLSNGGGELTINGAVQAAAQDDLHGEYPGLYRRFAAIIRARVSDVDVSPLRLVADSFLRARVNTVEDFRW